MSNSPDMSGGPAMSDDLDTGAAAQAPQVPEAPQVAEAPQAPEAPQGPQAPEPAELGASASVVPRRRARLLLRTVLPAVLVLAVAAGSVLYARHAADHADRTVPTVVWKKPPDPGEPGGAADDPAAGIGTGRTDSPLSKALLPVDLGALGPDLPGLGTNDAVLNSREAEAYRRQLLSEVAGPASGDAGAGAGEQAHIKGMAIRTYNDLYGAVTQIALARLADEGTARTAYAQSTLVGEAVGTPVTIPRHKSGAKCFRTPDGVHRDDVPETDASAYEDGIPRLSVFCVAYRKDLQIILECVDGDPSDLPASRAASRYADMFADQLDRLASDGKSI